MVITSMVFLSTRNLCISHPNATELRPKCVCTVWAQLPRFCGSARKKKQHFLLLLFFLSFFPFFFFLFFLPLQSRRKSIEIDRNRRGENRNRIEIDETKKDRSRPKSKSTKSKSKTIESNRKGELLQHADWSQNVSWRTAGEVACTLQFCCFLLTTAGAGWMKHWNTFTE